MSQPSAASKQASVTPFPPVTPRAAAAGRGSAAVRATTKAADPDAVLGTLLAKLRLLAGLTLKEAAAASGISAIRIAGAEEGDGWLPLTDARALARTYGIPFVAFAVRFERACTSAERRARRAAHPAEEPRP